MSQSYADNLRVVAGAFNLTVDELLQRVRLPPQSFSPAPSNDGQYFDVSGDLGSFGYASDPTGHHTTHFLEPPVYEHPQPGGFVSPPRSQPHQARNTTRPLQQVTEIQLLNQNAAFACDFSFHGIIPGLGEEDLELNDRSPPPGQSQSSYVAEDDSFVHLTPPWASSGLASGSIGPEMVKNESHDSASDWQMVSGSHESKSSELLSNSPDSTERIRFPLIAPKDLPVGQKRPSTSQDVSPTKIRKKRSPYEPSRKVDTNLTRQLNACVRCRMQRNRVSIPFIRD